jgi:hypothetical protein
MNYSQLFETIKGYVENDFPSTTWTDSAGTGTVVFTQKEQIDTFIQQAEQRIYNTIQFPAIRKNSTGTTTSGNKYLQQPSDFLYTYSLAVIDPVTGIYEYLLNKDVNFIREAFPYPAVTGKPTHYAYFDDNTFILGPTPDANYTMELHYGYYPTSIVTAGTTWLGNNMDSLLLYGSLLEAYTFMKGEQDVIVVYQKRYDEAFMMAKQLGDGKLRQDAYRDGQVRYPVK